MARIRRSTAAIIGILMLFVMLFSAFYISAETDHDCTGEDCPICACIQQCENTLHQIGDGIASSAAVIIPFAFLLVSIFHLASLFPQETLVSRKVRMNN